MEDTQGNPIHTLIFDDERIEKPKLSERQNKRRISSSSSDDDTNSSVVCSFKKKVKTFIDSEAEVEDEVSEDEEIEIMEREEVIAKDFLDDDATDIDRNMYRMLENQKLLMVKNLDFIDSDETDSDYEDIPDDQALDAEQLKGIYK